MTAYDCPTAARRQNLIEKRPVIRNPSRCAKEEVQKANHESQEDGARVRHRELGDMGCLGRSNNVRGDPGEVGFERI
jgi:hypothetical protein